MNKKIESVIMKNLRKKATGQTVFHGEILQTLKLSMPMLLKQFQSTEEGEHSQTSQSALP